MTQRMHCAVCSWILLAGCFNPEASDGSGGETETSGPTGGTMSSDDGSPTSLSAESGDGTPTQTSNDTTLDDTGCVHECEAVGKSCAGDMVETCEDGPDGCRVLSSEACPAGCDAGACLAEVDLAISIVSAAWVATNLEVTYVVANLGPGPSGDYRVDLWADRPGGFDDPPGVGDLGMVGNLKESLPAGDSVQYTDEVPNAPNGDHVAFAVVDADDMIVELDENNNTSLGFAWTNGADVVHTSFGALDAPIQIPDAGAFVISQADVQVQNFAPEIWFSLNVSHPDVSELEIEVVAPGGASRTLVLGAPSGSNFGGTTLRDGSMTLISEAAAPFLGEFEPATAWSGTPTANGTWELRLRDSVPGNEGRLNDWSVSFHEIDP